MSRDRLAILRDIWAEKGEEGLSIKEVIRLMLTQIGTVDDGERYELIHGAYQLFNEVDIYGDGSLAWDEFIQYIIDAVDGKAFKGGDAPKPCRSNLSS